MTIECVLIYYDNLCYHRVYNNIKVLTVSKQCIIRIRLPEDLMQKYKVFCAMNNMNMTQQTEHILREYIKENSSKIKIIKIENSRE